MLGWLISMPLGVGTAYILHPFLKKLARLVSWLLCIFIMIRWNFVTFHGPLPRGGGGGGGTDFILNLSKAFENQDHFCHLQSIRLMRALLTSKLCAEVSRTGYEYSLNPGNENSKLEMETLKFPAKIDFNFHWKSSSLQTEPSDFGPDFLFSFLNSAGWILSTRKVFATREELVDFDNAGCSLNEVDGI